MNNGLKHSLGAAAHALSGRIGRYKLGIFLFNRRKLALEHIVFIILNFGRILNIIFMAVIIKLIAELLCSVSRFFKLHNAYFLIF